jgi:hypothetical protein
MRKKKANVRNIQALVEHEKWLRKQGVHPEQLEVKKAKRGNVIINTIPDYRANASSIPTSDRVAGHGPAKESMTYSGERQLLGIATMHKSNLVPIFADKKEDAKDVASMRR